MLGRFGLGAPTVRAWTVTIREEVIRLNPDWIRLIELLVPLDTRKRGVEGRVRVVFGPFMVRAFTISPYITPKLCRKRLKTKPYSPIRRL